MDEHAERARAAQELVGTTLKGKWRLDSLIGVGGMAAVYAATHRNSKRVAIKMLDPSLSKEPTLRERFLREGYVGNQVDHPGAVTVDDDDLAPNGSAFLVMELMDGETLEARWRRKDMRLRPSEVLAMMDQVLDTLAAAHSKNIVHRDLKPENLFLTRAGIVKILDFGLARLEEHKAGKSATQPGTLMGTPVFMAPEQARGRWTEVDARTDLWAIGASMYTMITGKYVHDAETVNETVAMAITRRAESIRNVMPDLPPKIVALVDRALEYEPEKRWQSAHEFQAALLDAYESVQGSENFEPAIPSGPFEAPPQPQTPIAPDPEIPAEIVVPEARAQTVTTGRGVTSSMNHGVGRRFGLSPMLVIVGTLITLAAAGTVYVLGGGDSASAGTVVAGSNAPAAAAPSVPVVHEELTEAEMEAIAAEQMKLEGIDPVVGPAALAPAKADAATVSLDSLPKEDTAPKRAPPKPRTSPASDAPPLRAPPWVDKNKSRPRSRELAPVPF